MTPRRFTDAELCAYIDCEMSTDELAEIESHLSSDPDLSTRVDQFRDDTARLRAAFDPMLDDPVPGQLMTLLNTDAEGERGRSWRRIAAALAIFCLGLASGWLIRPILPGSGAPGPATAELAIDAHRIYVSEKRHAVEVGVDEREHLISWLSKRVGYKLIAPDLSSKGFQLVGGRLLPGQGKAAAHFMYESEPGQRVTLYVVNNAQGSETAFRLVAQDDTHAFYWMDPNLGYALAGDIEENDLLAIARLVYDQSTTDTAAEP